MAEDRCAMAEAVIASIVTDDIDELSTAMSTTADRETWRAVLRHELPIEQLIDVGGLLQYDLFAAKLLCVGCTRALTPWHVAGLRGADDALLMFVERLKQPVDCLLPNSGATALQLACFAGHTDTVRTLVDRLKADVNRSDDYGWTTLHYAAIEGQFDIVELLLERGVDVTARDKDGATAAFRANVACHDDVVCLMQSTILTGNDDLLAVQLDDDDSSRQPPQAESLYANVKKHSVKQDTKGGNTVTIGESVYHLASPVTEKEKTTELVRRAISDELREVLGNNEQEDYLAPVHTSSTRLDNIGYNTLTRVLREELRRFRADEVAATRSSTSEAPQNSSSSWVNGKERRTNRDYEEIEDVINEISQRQTVEVPQFAAPPLPLRHSTSSTTSPTTQHTCVDQSVQRMTEDNTRRRRALHVDDESVIKLLERIEQSSVELDMSFTALVDVGLKCDGDWQRLAHELPICNPAKLARRIALIEERYSGDRRRQAAVALAEWRSYRRNEATLRELISALRRCDLLEEATFLGSMSQESAI